MHLMVESDEESARLFSQKEERGASSLSDLTTPCVMLWVESRAVENENW